MSSGNLLSFISKVSTAPAGIVIRGESKDSRRLCSLVGDYFAYAAFRTIFIFKLPEFTLVSSINSPSETICNLRLSPANDGTLVFATIDCNLVFYNFLKRMKHWSMNLDSVLTGKSFTCIEFMNNKEVILFSELAGIEVIVDLRTREVTRGSGVSCGNAMHLFAPHPELTEIALAVDHNNKVHVINSKKLFHNYIPLTNTYHLSYDPLNTMHCLRVGKNPTWTVFSFVPEPMMICQAPQNNIEARFGDWIPAMPGHIITGSATSGVLHIWCVANGAVIDTIQLEDAPVSFLARFTDKMFVVAFADGNYGIVDVSTRRYVHKMNAAHTNTIFASTIVPTDSSILLTGGADGRICMWNLPSLEKRGHFRGSRDTALMCICVSPGGGYVASGSLDGKIYIISLKTKTILFSMKMHKGKCTSIEWSPHNSDIIATAGDDGVCNLFNIKERRIETSINTKSNLRKAKFSRKQDMIALGCKECLEVRSGCDYTTSITIPVEHQIYDIAWSPFTEKLVAATDDDGGVTVFDLEKRSLMRGVGHNTARAILWSEAVEWLVISGGYDGRLVFWDTRNMSQVGYVNAHVDHIYGLSSPPDHPMMIISVSRDQTIRAWNCDKLVPTMKITDMMNADDEIIAGRFSPYEGARELNKLIRRIRKDKGKISFGDDELCHMNDVLRLTKKQITRMSAANPQDQGLILRSKQYKKATMETAEICLKSGDVKRYCELMFMAGEYDRALGAAPAVSYAFWQNLTLERAKMLKGTDEAADLALIAGQPKNAIAELTVMKKYDSAMVVAASMRDCSFQPRTKTCVPKPKELEQPPFIRSNFNNTTDFEPYKVASKRSIRFAMQGKPLLSAASLLSVGDALGAAWRLVHCGEIAWALEINKLLENPDPKIEEIWGKYCVSHRCMHLLFPKISGKLRRRLIPLVIFRNEEDRESCYKTYGLKPPCEYLEEAKTQRGLSKIQLLILAGKIDQALTYTIQNLRILMSTDTFNFYEAMSYVSMIEDVAFSTENCKSGDEVIAISYYFAVYKAMWRGYSPIVAKLVASFEEIVTSSGISWLESRVPELKLAAALAVAKDDSTMGKAYLEIAHPDCTVLENLPDNLSVDGGSTVKYNGTGIIPIDIANDPPKSICTGKPIHGNTFMLEDRESMMEPEEALMWFEVTPFSPLWQHSRLTPY